MTDATNDNFEDFNTIREKFVALCATHWGDRLDMDAVRRFPDNAFWWMLEITDLDAYNYVDERESLSYWQFCDFCTSEVPTAYMLHLCDRAQAGNLPYRPDKAARPIDSDIPW